MARAVRIGGWLAVAALVAGCGSSGGPPDAGADPASETADVAVEAADVAVEAVADLPDAADAPSADATAHDVTPREIPEVSFRVDPMIGTGGSGNANPGPCMPHGMVKLSPDTHDEPASIFAYRYDNTRIEGFSHTHFEGPGGSNNGYSQILVVPTVGAVVPGEDHYASAFRHDTEVVKAGYYAVTLDDPGVRAELTAAARCGVHRYTFPASQQANVLLDAGHTRGAAIEGDVHVVGPDVLEGHGTFQINPLVSAMVGDSATGTTGISTVYFHAKFSRAFASSGTWVGGDVHPGQASETGTSVGAYVTFATAAGEVVEVRVGISFVSVEQAKANLADCTAPFDDVRQAAERAWDRLLSRVEIEGGADADSTLFYTSLYHVFLQPADYTEDGRYFLGADGAGKVFDAPDWRYYTDDWCMWDTFRTSHPLFTLLEPEVPSDMIHSLIRTYQEGGWMQKCTWNGTGDSRVMTANPQFCIVADAFVKGFRQYDTQAAWDALYKGAMSDSHNLLEDSLCGYFNQGTPPDYVDHGFVPDECDHDQGASMTLEYAYNDFCIARVAEGMGRADDVAFFDQRSGNWKNVFDATSGFARPKHRSGDWYEPFTPLATAGFCEGTAWQWTWSVQHDICGLVTAMGGRAAFVAKLDELFAKGYYAADNEPDFHVPFLYDFVGAAAKTQKAVADLRKGAYQVAPGGLPGNDDAGATSGWYVLAAMGLYPVTPGDGMYWLTTPAFDRVTLHVDPDRNPGVDFVITAPGASAGKLYIASAKLNGQPLDVPRVKHSDLVAGGSLEFTLSDQPTAWGQGICP